MLGATLLFIFGKKLAGNRASSVGHDATTAAIVGASFFELIVSVYGGYFGGGVGIVNLAMFAAVGMTDIHAMNALKSILGVAINGVAASGVRGQGRDLLAAGHRHDRRRSGGRIFRGALCAEAAPGVGARFVILVGTGMTVYFFVKAYGV